MTTRAYILIQAEMGSQRALVDALSSLEGVQVVDAVTGPYDNIAMVEAPDLNKVGELVNERIHRLNGVLHTITCLVQSAPPSP